uniref:F5/8 type C domain-containing protein n=1 Tax=Anas platyrhynchos platyrhynchos TaxID=8840 RepID=A0A493TU08_ANAPP
MPQELFRAPRATSAAVPLLQTAPSLPHGSFPSPFHPLPASCSRLWGRTSPRCAPASAASERLLFARRQRGLCAAALEENGDIVGPGEEGGMQPGGIGSSGLSGDRGCSCGGGGDTQGASCPPGIVTKGSEMYDCYVTSYSVSSSRDGRNWRPYRGSGGQEDKVGAGALVLGWAPAPARSSGAIPATSARCLKATWTAAGRSPTPSSPPIVTRYLRVTPHSWHQRIAMKVALLGCPTVRVRAPRPYAPSDHQEVPLPVPTSRSPGRTPVPGVALDPEKAGYPKLESSQVCSLGSLPPPGSTPPSFPAAAALGDLSQPHSPEYAEPDLVQVNPSSQPGPSTFKPPPDEGYTLPLVVSHYAVPGQYHEYAEPLPPEPEYAMPFGDPEPHGTRCGMAGLPAALSRAGCPESPLARYDAPTLPGEPQGLSGANAAPRGELPPRPPWGQRLAGASLLARVPRGLVKERRRGGGGH